jgi:hypothetical protein
LNERFEQYINSKRENLHSNFTLRLKKILWEARSTPTLEIDLFLFFVNTISLQKCFLPPVFLGFFYNFLYESNGAVSFLDEDKFIDMKGLFFNFLT